MLDAQNGSQKQAMADKVLHRDLKSEQYESIKLLRKVSRSWSAGGISRITVNKGNIKITELRTILQRESQNS